MMLIGLQCWKRKLALSLLLSYMFLVFATTVLARTWQETARFAFTFVSVRDWHHFASNIVMFIPIGILLPMVVKRWSGLWGVLFSCFIECSQLLFHKGLCETGDVLSNALGVIIGFALYQRIHKAENQNAEGSTQVYKRHIKRIIDIIISLCILIFLSPLFLITAVAIKLESKGPVIFKQTRLGLHHQRFTLLKFRSMVVNAEHTGSGVYSDANDERVTHIGHIIRATSIDELPQAVNILKGDMSLIGPRPPLTYHPWPLEQYTAEELHMFDIRPGITGWAQVNGRKDVEWHERIRLNNWYVDHCSFLLDVKIFFMTIGKVLSNADNANTGKTVE